MHEISTEGLIILMGLFTAFGGCLAFAFEDVQRHRQNQRNHRRFKKWLEDTTRKDKE